MKTKTLLLTTLSLFIFSVSCQKEQEHSDENHTYRKYCHCEDPRPVSPDGHIPDISWADYNSVQDVCFHFERIVRGWDICTGRLREFGCLDHIGDTLKVYGWLYNAENTNVVRGGDWIANDPKYASGLEKYPPWAFTVRGFEEQEAGFGGGVKLKNLHVKDSSLIKNKCFVKGTIGYTSAFTEDGVGLGAKDACQHLALTLDVVDIFFEEDGK